MPGFFATFEGGEGAGKGSALAALAAELRAQGHDPLLTREPGGSEECKPIRALLVETGRQWSPLAETLLLMADRAQHVAGTIRPALEQGRIVLCDRFGASTLAYQGAGKGVDAGLIAQLQHSVAPGLVPDLTILLDVAPEVGLARSRRRLESEGSREGRFEALDLAFHQRVRESFLAQARSDPARWAVVDASAPLADVVRQVGLQFFKRLGP